MTLLSLLDFFGTAVFAVSGCLAAGRRRMDLFGALVLGMVTALGGGTLRDLVLGVRPVFWIERPAYLWVALGAGLATFAVVRVGRVPRRALMLSDALGLAVFTVIGCAVALPLVDSALVVVLMGMLSGVAGGITRDMLSAEVPLIFRTEIYATASLSGGAVFVALRALDLASPTRSSSAWRRPWRFGSRPCVGIWPCRGSGPRSETANIRTNFGGPTTPDSGACGCVAAPVDNLRKIAGKAHGSAKFSTGLSTIRF